VRQILDGFAAILAGNAFANAFWVFVGVVVGALIQYLLGWLTVRSQKKNAMKALLTEVSMNRSEVAEFKKRLGYLRERIAANQISEIDLFVSMQGFDYSIVNPLVSSGHFHVLLGHKDVKNYFEFMKFFNNSSAELINSMLRTEHEKAKSLDYLTLLEEKASALLDKLHEVQSVAESGQIVYTLPTR
jgi:hypothetical protein